MHALITVQRAVSFLGRLGVKDAKVQSSPAPCSLPTDSDGLVVSKPQIFSPLCEEHVCGLLEIPQGTLNRSLAAAVTRWFLKHEAGHVRIAKHTGGYGRYRSEIRDAMPHTWHYVGNLVEDIFIEANFEVDTVPRMRSIRRLVDVIYWPLWDDFGPVLAGETDVDPDDPNEFIKIQAQAMLLRARHGAVKVEGERRQTLPNARYQATQDRLKPLFDELVYGDPEAVMSRMYAIVDEVLAILIEDAEFPDPPEEESEGTGEGNGEGQSPQGESGDESGQSGESGESSQSGDSQISSGQSGEATESDRSDGPGQSGQSQSTGPEGDGNDTQATDGSDQDGSDQDGSDQEQGAGSDAGSSPDDADGSTDEGNGDPENSGSKDRQQPEEDAPTPDTPAGQDGDEGKGKGPQGAPQGSSGPSSGNPQPGQPGQGGQQPQSGPRKVDDAVFDQRSPMKDALEAGDGQALADALRELIDDLSEDLQSELETLERELQSIDREADRAQARAAKLAAQDAIDESNGIDTWRTELRTVTPDPDLRRKGRELSHALRAMLRSQRRTSRVASEGTSLDFGSPVELARAMDGHDRAEVWSSPGRLIEVPRGLDVVVAGDYSYSMMGYGEDSPLKRMMSAMATLAVAFDRLPEVHLGLTGFGSENYVIHHLDEQMPLNRLLGDIVTSENIMALSGGTTVTPSVLWAQREFARAGRPGVNKLFVLITDGQLMGTDVESASALTQALRAEGIVSVGVALPGALVETIEPIVDTLIDLRTRPDALANTLSRVVHKVVNGKSVS